MTYTAPLVAGGMMVGAFALMAAHASIEPEVGPQTVSSSRSVVQASTTQAHVEPIQIEDFLSDPTAPTVTLADFESEETRQVHYVPLSTQQYVRTQ